MWNEKVNFELHNVFPSRTKDELAHRNIRSRIISVRGLRYTVRTRSCLSESHPRLIATYSETFCVRVDAIPFPSRAGANQSQYVASHTLIASFRVLVLRGLVVPDDTSADVVEQVDCVVMTGNCVLYEREKTKHVFNINFGQDVAMKNTDNAQARGSLKYSGRPLIFLYLFINCYILVISEVEVGWADDQCFIAPTP